MYTTFRSMRNWNGQTLRFLQTQYKPRAITNFRDNNETLSFLKAVNFTDRIAMYDPLGSYTYANIFMAAKELSKEISQQLGGKTNEKVIFLTKNNASYLITMWACWMSGQISEYLYLLIFPFKLNVNIILKNNKNNSY